MMLAALSEYKDWRHAEGVDEYAKRLAARILFDSLTAAASACALMSEALVNTYGAKIEVRDYWKQLYSRSFPAKALWKLYIEKALTPPWLP